VTSPLTGPVAVCIDRPLLALDRTFTYRAPEELALQVGSLVSVPFHGKKIKGWVLGPTEEIPKRMLAIKDLVSPVRFFDDEMLALYRWVSYRYVVPLASVIARATPPRVVSEEDPMDAAPTGVGSATSTAPLTSTAPTAPLALLGAYRGGDRLLEALAGHGGRFVHRPVPEQEIDCVLEGVARCVAQGRRVIVIVPESKPLPATALALQEAFGERVGMYLGGTKRERYRRWLEIAEGTHEVIVGTRPAIFAPIKNLGLIWVSRESHPAHREDRSPYYHVRDVALARGAHVGATVVLSSLCPSIEATAVEAVEVTPGARSWMPVEVLKPGPEGRAPRLMNALKQTQGAFLLEPLRGYGVAQVCRQCGEPAACASCGGMLRAEGGALRCVVCETVGRCARCGADAFGLRKGGAERVEEWAGKIAPVPVRKSPPRRGAVVVGGTTEVHDIPPPDLDLVGVLDADLLLRRPGVDAEERATTMWFEAAAWARPRGRTIVQTAAPNHPGIQALVAGNPSRFHRYERERRAAAGFPVGHPVFRVAGTAALEAALGVCEPETFLVTGAGDERVCLLTLRPEILGAFGEAMRRLAQEGVVTRVEAEPHL